MAVAAGTPVTVVPGVLVDGPRQTVFVMQPRLKIEAVALASGKTRWSSKAAEKPLWIAGSSLLAQRGSELVVLAATTGKLVRACSPTAGTTWQPPPISGQLGSTQSMVAEPSADSRVTLAWTIDTSWSQGVAPRPGDITHTHTEGRVEVDIAACTFRELSSTNVATSTVPYPITTTTDARGVTTHTQVLAAANIDGTVVEIVRDTVSPTWRAYLRRAQGGATIELYAGPAVNVYGRFSADGRHALVVAQGSTSAPGSSRLVVVDALTGTPAFSAADSWSIGAFVIAGSSLVDSLSDVARRIDTRTAKLGWKRGVRSTVYRGPMPP